MVESTFCIGCGSLRNRLEKKVERVEEMLCQTLAIEDQICTKGVFHVLGSWVDLCDDAVEKLGKVVIWPFWMSCSPCDEFGARALPLTGTTLPFVGAVAIRGSSSASLEEQKLPESGDW